MTSGANGLAYAPYPANDIDEGVVYPPYWIVVVAALAVLASAVLFVSTSDPMHWFGYAIGAFGTALAVIAFRHVDLKRRRSPSYIDKAWPATTATVLLLVGIGLGIVHAYFALQTTTIQ